MSVGTRNIDHDCQTIDFRTNTINQMQCFVSRLQQTPVPVVQVPTVTDRIIIIINLSSTDTS
jgi:hypothetical protein